MVVMSLVVGMMAIGSPAQANDDLVRATFSGEIQFADSCFGGSLMEKPFYFEITYDTTTPDIWLDAQIGIYPGAVVEASGFLGPHQLQMGASAAPFTEITVVNDRESRLTGTILDEFYIHVPLEEKIDPCPVLNQVNVRFVSTADPFPDDTLQSSLELSEDSTASFIASSISGCDLVCRAIVLASGSVEAVTFEPVVADGDGDGVPDEDDICPETIIPDPVIPTSGELGVNRYALVDADTMFDTNTAQNDGATYTTADTGGCNATQIADALGLGASHYEKGITKSALETWIEGLKA